VASGTRERGSVEAGLIADPGAASALEALGLGLRDSGDVAPARLWLRRATFAEVGRSRAEAALALICHQASDWSGASRHSRRTLALDPIAVEAAANGAATLLELGENTQAIRWLLRAAALAPHWFVPHGNLGNALRAKGSFGAARRALRRSLVLEPRSAPIWANLAQVEQAIMRAAAADTQLARALAIAPHPAIHSNLVFVRSYRPDVDESRLYATVRRWATSFTRPMPRPAIRDPDPERRLRVGYLSADLRSHPVGWNLVGLIDQHDRSQVETFAYAAVSRPDGLTARFAKSFAHWRQVTNLNDTALAARIAADRIDILVVVAGHTEGSRLAVAGLRPAPVQASIHDLTSTGVDGVDYWFTDAILSPDRNDERFVETPAYLPSFYLHMLPEAPEVIRPAGDPAGPVVFGCCNNPAKLSDDVLELWAAVLAAVPGSCLVFRYFDHFASEDGQMPIIRALERQGVARRRLRFETGLRDRGDQFRHLASVDIALDPFPFNGATTTFESLWMGVPVVTLAGRRFVGRVTASHLHHIGLDELVAASPADYVRIAAALANDASRRGHLRQTLRARLLDSALCDKAAYARNVERAFRQMWRAACADQRWDGRPASE